MGEKITLKIAKREVLGKKVKTLRRQGITPGVVYGPPEWRRAHPRCSCPAHPARKS